MQYNLVRLRITQLVSICRVSFGTCAVSSGLNIFLRGGLHASEPKDRFQWSPEALTNRSVSGVGLKDTQKGIPFVGASRYTVHLTVQSNFYPIP